MWRGWDRPSAPARRRRGTRPGSAARPPDVPLLGGGVEVEAVAGVADPRPLARPTKICVTERTPGSSSIPELGVCVADMGVAALLESRGERSEIVGTPDYMAPECVLQGDVGRVRTRAGARGRVRSRMPGLRAPHRGAALPGEEGDRGQDGGARPRDASEAERLRPDDDEAIDRRAILEALSARSRSSARTEERRGRSAERASTPPRASRVAERGARSSSPKRTGRRRLPRDLGRDAPGSTSPTPWSKCVSDGDAGARGLSRLADAVGRRSST